MTVDTTVQPGVFNIRQNGSAAVASGTTLTVESGGTARVESGGALTVADGAKLYLPVTTQATTSGTITNYGVTTIGTTIASGYTLADPDAAGLVKTIVCTVHGATTVAQVITTAAATITGATTATVTHVTITSRVGFVTLVATSTSNWAVMAKSATDVAFS